MNETCKHHEAIEQCAHSAKKIAIGATKGLKTKVNHILFFWVAGGLASIGILLFYIACSRCANVELIARENSRLFHQIDKNISVIATSIGCGDKLEKYTGKHK